MAGRRKFSVWAEFRALDKITRPVRKMSSSVKKFSMSAERSVNRVNSRVNKLGSSMRQVGYAATAAGAVVAMGMKDVISKGAAFEQSITSATAKYPGMALRGSKAFSDVSEAARKYGRETEFTAVEVADAVNRLARSGQDAAKTTAALPGVINLATAAEIGLADATSMSLDSLGAFNLLVDDAIQLQTNLTRVTDTLAKTANSSNTSVSAFFEAIAEGGPIVSSVAGDIETFGALSGKLASAGIKGSKAGMVLKNMFISLTGATPQANKMLRRLGVQVADDKGNMRDIIDILEDFNKALGKHGNVRRSAMLGDIFTRRALPGVNKLLAIGADELREYRRQVEDSENYTARLAGVMRSTVGVQWRKFISAVTSVELSIFDKIRDRLIGITRKMTGWVIANEDLISGKVGDFLNNLIDNLDVIGSKAATILKVVGVITALVIILKTLVLVLTAVNLVMMLNPVGLIVLAIVAAIAAVGLLAAKFEGFRNVMKGLWDSIMRGANPFFAQIALAIAGIKKIAQWAGIGGGGGVEEPSEGTTSSNMGFWANGGYDLSKVSTASDAGRRMEDWVAELTIRDETGRASFGAGDELAPAPPGVTLIPSGGF